MEYARSTGGIATVLDIAQGGSLLVRPMSSASLWFKTSRCRQLWLGGAGKMVDRRALRDTVAVMSRVLVIGAGYLGGEILDTIVFFLKCAN